MVLRLTTMSDLLSHIRESVYEDQEFLEQSMDMELQAQVDKVLGWYRKPVGERIFIIGTPMSRDWDPDYHVWARRNA